MKARPSIVLTLFVAVCGGVVALQARALAVASERHGRAERLLTKTAADVREIAALRGRAEQVAAGRRPDQAIIACVNDALARAGIDPNAKPAVFDGQTPETDAALPAGSPGAPTYRRQAVRLSFSGLAPSRLGAFLAAWRIQQPMWAPTRIALVHRSGQDRAAEDRNLYDATIVISAVYLDLPADAEGAAGNAR